MKRDVLQGPPLIPSNYLDNGIQFSDFKAVFVCCPMLFLISPISFGYDNSLFMNLKPLGIGILFADQANQSFCKDLSPDRSSVAFVVLKC